MKNILRYKKALREAVLSAGVVAIVIATLFLFFISTKSDIMDTYAQTVMDSASYSEYDLAYYDDSDGHSTANAEDTDSEDDSSVKSSGKSSAKSSTSSSGSKSNSKSSSSSQSNKTSSKASSKSSSSKASSSKADEQNTTSEDTATHIFQQLSASQLATVESEFTALVNSYRQAKGLSAYPQNNYIQEATSIRKNEINQTNDFNSIEYATTRPNYKSYWSVYDDLGVSEDHYNYGEVIGSFVYEADLEDCNLSSPSFNDLQRLAQSLFSSFSQNGNYSWVLSQNRVVCGGIGISNNTYSKIDLPANYQKLQNEQQLVLIVNVEIVTE